jgi:hypothetical protein
MSGGLGELRLELSVPRLLLIRDCHKVPVQTVSRFEAHGFDRWKVFRADLVRLQQLLGGVFARLNQQVHRPLDKFGTADGVATGFGA